MRKFEAVVALLVGLTSVALLSQAKARNEPTIAWQFDIHDDNAGQPRGNVLIVVDGKITMIAKSIDEQFTICSRSDYGSHKIPPAAITACTGWWAGAGDDFYVVGHGQRLRVYHRGTDEQGPVNPPYELVKSIPLDPH
jgi:hypothetical protein